VTKRYQIYGSTRCNGICIKQVSALFKEDGASMFEQEIKEAVETWNNHLGIIDRFLDCFD
jgi:predicted Zn-dependent protease